MKIFYICLLVGGFMSWFATLIWMLVAGQEWGPAKKVFQVFLVGVLMSAIFIGLLKLSEIVQAMP